MRAAVLVFAIGCGTDFPPPIEVSNGRLTAEIHEEPAQIELLLDGKRVWATRPGEQRSEDGAPHGFAAIGSRATTIEMSFGSFKFEENTSSEVWQTVQRLTDITPTTTGATFNLQINGEVRGTGVLSFVTETRSGPDPDAAGFPRHVRIELEVDSADRIQLASETTETEHLVGLGGQSFDVDHNGETVPLFVQEDGIGKFPDPDDHYDGLWFFTGRKHSTHTPMPMLLSSRGYAVVVDTDARGVFDLNDSRPGASRFEAWSNRLDLQVFIGDGPHDGDVDGEATRDALGHMIAWVGKPDRPPVSIFAPWIDALFGSDNLRRIAGVLRANGIASSAIWAEDWRGGSDGATGYALDEDWRIDRALYPDVEQLSAELRGQGFAFLTYHNTFIDESADIYEEATTAGYAIKDADGNPYEFTGITFKPSTLLDLTNTEGYAWAKGVMGEARTVGSDGWMADFAEWQPTDAVLASGEDALAVHNRYPVDWARFNHELFSTPIAGRPTPLWFVRSAWLHSQPQVQVVWPGDQQTDFSEGDGLPSVIPMGINLGLAGFPYFGSDIAGYMSQGTTPTTSELFHRWTTFGALQPVMRTHHGRSARENVQWETDATTIAHFRRWSRVHMQLLPYFVGLIASFERDGLPLMRMIALHYPDEAWAWTTIDQYLLGDRLLVAPVQVEGALSREVILPAGDWVHWFGGPLVSGTITADAPLTEIPVFVPAGSLLVVNPEGVDTVLDAPQSAATRTLAENGDDREVWLYPGVALDPAHASWNDDTGTFGTAHWTWTGRPPGPEPTTATFNGAPVTVTNGDCTVIGDGTLEIGGGTLTIARGKPGASTHVRLR